MKDKTNDKIKFLYGVGENGSTGKLGDSIIFSFEICKFYRFHRNLFHCIYLKCLRFAHFLHTNVKF